MNTEIVSLMAKTLNISDELVSAETLTDEQKTELTGKLESLKVYDPAGLESLLTNVRKDHASNITGEIKGKALESIEKDLMTKYGVDYKRGTDYQNTQDLVAKILSETTDGGDETLKKDLEAARKALGERTSEYENKINELNTLHSREKTGMILDNSLKSIGSQIDVEPDKVEGQLKFLKYEFSQAYELQEKDGQLVVFDKDKQEVVKNETDHSPETLSNVLGKMAPTLVKFKKVDDKKGRADDNLQKPATDVLLKSFKTRDDVDKYLKDKQINPMSAEGQELYFKWKTSQTTVA